MSLFSSFANVLLPTIRLLFPSNNVYKLFHHFCRIFYGIYLEITRFCHARYAVVFIECLILSLKSKLTEAPQIIESRDKPFGASHDQHSQGEKMEIILPFEVPEGKFSNITDFWINF